MEVLQTSALPLGYGAETRRDALCPERRRSLKLAHIREVVNKSSRLSEGALLSDDGGQ